MPQKLPRFVGHRGTMLYRSENTREAFDYTYRLKPAFEAVGSSLSFEFDVRLTKDNMPILTHDPILWKTAGKNMAVADITYTELQQTPMNAPVKSHPGTVITLREMFEYYPGIVFDAEIKEKGERGKKLADIFVPLIREFAAAEHIIMHIPCLETAKHAQETFPKGVRYELPSTLIAEFTQSVFHGKTPRYHEGFQQMCFEFMPLIEGQLVSCTQSLFIDAARECGYSIITYWEDAHVAPVTEAMLRESIAVGADSVIVNDPLQALKVFADYCASDGIRKKLPPRQNLCGILVS